MFRLSILWTYNYCKGFQIHTFFDYALNLIQLSFLFYIVLKFKNLLELEIVLLTILVYLTIILFMAEILPKIILEYIVVSTSFTISDTYIRCLCNEYFFI